MTVNERIKQLRIDNNLTQREFASRLGKTDNYISLIEKGSRTPSDTFLTEISMTFNVNVNWLKYGEETKEQTISQRIKEIRVSKKMSQSEFAENLAFSLSYLNQIECGYEPTERFLKDVATTYAIDLEWLKTGKGDRDNPKKKLDEITALALEKLNNVNNELRDRLIHLIVKLPDSDLELLTKVAERMIVANENKED